MRIKSIAFKNFGSYGNKLQEIEFSNETGNFYLIVGSNGAGKSTISDAIKFGLYGKLDNKKMSDIPNRFNGGSEVKVTIHKGHDTIITIERGVYPNFFRVYVNGVEYDQAGKKNVQSFLEEEILGMPYYVFNNVISLSVNDFRSFISMGTNDKRLIIDRIFGLEILNHMRWKIRDEMKVFKEEIDRLITEISVLEHSIVKSNEELESLNEKLKNASDEKKITIEQQMNDCQDFLVKVDEKLTQVLTRERELKTQESSAMNKMQQQIEKLKASIAPIGELFAKIFTPVLNFFVRMFDKFNEMPDEIKRIVYKQPVPKYAGNDVSTTVTYIQHIFTHTELMIGLPSVATKILIYTKQLDDTSDKGYSISGGHSYGIIGKTELKSGLVS
jgi:DNA repair exonuclease SbcCD ATPase subunit